jgi:ABC-type lipoprotein release transport system permease subunit
VWSIVIAAVAALVLANLAAVLPGRRAAHTATALILQDE